MNSHDTHNLSYLRRQYGLLWPTSRPPIPWRATLRTALIIVGLLGLYGLVDANDRATDARLEAAQATGQLLACLNGQLYLVDSDEATGTRCFVAETVSLK